MKLLATIEGESLSDQRLGHQRGLGGRGTGGDGHTGATHTKDSAKKARRLFTCLPATNDTSSLIVTARGSSQITRPQ